MTNPADEFSPWFPEDREHRLENLAAELLLAVGRLRGAIPPQTWPGLQYVVRLSNCFHSNAIEGDPVRPDHTEEALAGNWAGKTDDYDGVGGGSMDERAIRRKQDKEALGQLGANHFRAQEAIHSRTCPNSATSLEFLLWAHRTVFTVPPGKRPLLGRHWPDSDARLIPGEFRQEGVRVGSYVAPNWQRAGELMEAFCRVYSEPKLSKVERIIAIAAAHHRFVWIHPFLDGNGRVSRLLTDAMLRDLGLSSELWSTWRSFARSRRTYWDLLQEADEIATEDDGPGRLSMRGLERFCEYFLTCCVDQVRQVTETFEPSKLARGLIYQVDVALADHTRRSELLKEAVALLTAVARAGELARGDAQRATGLGRAWASEVMRRLLGEGLLVADRPKGPVRLGFPARILNWWMVKL